MEKKRISLITLFDDDSLQKLKNSIKAYDNNFCKVPFRVNNRIVNDTLPYHFTLASWEADEIELAQSIMEKIKFDIISIKIIGVDIKESYNNSWNLYFCFEMNNDIYDLQKEIFCLSGIEKYNPDVYIPHITIHCDMDYQKLINIKNEIMNNFIPFDISFSEIGLFKIYPAIRIK